MAAAESDLGRHMGEVARLLLGEPNKALSSALALRFGTYGSLSVDLAKGTFFDHEAQEGGGVLQLLKRSKGFTNGEAVDWLRDHNLQVGDRARAGESKPTGKIVETYDYVDENGDHVMQVCRLEPKTFLQRRKARPADPPDKVKDGWVWSIKGVRLYPYRYPELLEDLSSDRLVVIVEGEKDVDNLAALGVPATTNPMGAGKWPDYFRDYFAEADVVIIYDDDPQSKNKDGSFRFHPDGRPVFVGRDHADDIGANLSGVAKRVRVLHLPALPPKGDITDWIEAGGTAERLYELVETQAQIWAPPTRPLAFGAVWFAHTHHAIEDPEWLIDDLLTRGDTSLLYGASQSGKSFLATHLSLAIARGVKAFDRRVRRGGVIYIAAEGQRGFKNRLWAYRHEFKIEAGFQLPHLLVPSALDLFAADGDTPTLLAGIPAIRNQMNTMSVELELVVIDTFAAVTPGANENTSEDVGRVIKHCKAIQEASNAHVMIVHHKNAAGERPRGHTSLYAAMDNAIEVTCDEARNRTAKIMKLKDGEDGGSIGFRLQSVTIGHREDDGKPITSCVVVPADAATARTGKGPRTTDQQTIALRALRTALIDFGEPAPATLDLPFGTRVVRFNHWKTAFRQMAFDEEPNDATFRSALKRVGDALLAKGIIGRSQPYLWIVREPSQ